MNESKSLDAKKCDHGTPKLVFAEPIKVWAGAAEAYCPIPPGAVLLDLADMYTFGYTAYGLKLPKHLNYKRIQFDWPDMGKAKVGKQQWQHFARWFKQDFTKKGIYISCMAGHGRTGTALVILGSMLNAIPKGIDPVKYVRDVYCDRAVESSAQIDYINAILDIKTTEKPSTTGMFTFGGAWDKGGFETCYVSIQGTECLHDCYATTKGHTTHWCKKCKWDWTITTGNLEELPGPELKTNYAVGFKRIISPAPPVTSTYKGPAGAPVKSAEESAQVFKENLPGHITKEACYAVAPAHLDTETCTHLCSRPENHAGSHECELCYTKWGYNGNEDTYNGDDATVDRGASTDSDLECNKRWHSHFGCADHICRDFWGHRGTHYCEVCQESNDTND